MRNLLIILGLFVLPLTVVKAADAQGYKHKIPVHEKVTRGCGGKEWLDDCKALACEIAKRRALEKVGITSVKTLTEAELQNQGTPDAQLRLMKEQLSSIAEGKLTEIKVIQNTVANDSAICELEAVVLSNSPLNPPNVTSPTSPVSSPEDKEFLKLLDEAKKIYNSALESYRSGRGSNRVTEQVSKVIDLVDKGLEIKPDSGKAWKQRGDAWVLRDWEGWANALKSYENAIKFEQANVEYLSSYGKTLGLANQVKKALEICDKAIQINANHFESWFCRGFVFSQGRKHKEALESYEKALRIQPNDVELLFQHGLTLSSLGRYKEAIDSYNEALKIDPYFENVKRERSKAVQHMAAPQSKDSSNN
jgi:tetratricopeptide (TPR) repeat protein